MNRNRLLNPLYTLLLLLCVTVNVTAQESPMLSITIMPSVQRARELKTLVIAVSLLKPDATIQPLMYREAYSVSLEPGATEARFYNVAPGNYRLQVCASLQTNFRKPALHVLIPTCQSMPLTITGRTSTTMRVGFPDYCPYYDHRNDPVCPVCSKKDKVVPVLYGMYIEDLSAAGNPDDPWLQPHYSGGCEVTGCDPNWYCEKDRLLF